MKATPTPRMLLLACAMATLLAGCDYDVPLVEKPEQPMDSALVGRWEAREDKDDTVIGLLILPFSKTEYLVVYSQGTRSLYAQACLCKAAEFALVQLKWIGNEDGTAVDKKWVYQYAAYSIDGDKLTTRQLSPEVVRPVDTAAALLASIKANGANPELFDNEMTFTRVRPKPDRAAPPVRPPVPKD